MFNLMQMDVIEFCAKECQRQESGEMSVYHMLLAYSFAANWTEKQDFNMMDLIELLGRAVEPIKNYNGFRNTPVSFSDGTVNNLTYDGIYRQLDKLLSKKLFSADPKLFYMSFQEIHPFADGNGRVGAILFNLINKTIHVPVVPPEFNRGLLNRRENS